MLKSAVPVAIIASIGRIASKLYLTGIAIYIYTAELDTRRI